MLLLIVVCIIAILIPLVAYFFYPILVAELFRDIRALRVLHYILLACFGTVLFNNSVTQLLHSHLFIATYILYIIALTYAAVFAIVTNNIADIVADSISNKERPLIKGTVNKKEYLFAGYTALLIALVVAFFGGYKILISIVALSLGYYLYSCKPFQLKRFPFLSKTVIGINSLIAAITGFIIAGGTVQSFPIEWALYIVLPLALSANFIDLKDIEGDKAMNVITLPLLFGEKKAKLLIAVATTVAYFVPAFFINNTYMYIAAPLMLIMHIGFLYKKPYKEKPIFIIYLLSIAGLIFFHCF